EALLADSPQFLWITRGITVWGREAALQRFAKLYEGTWRLDPDPSSIRVVPLANDVAQLHATVQFTTGAPGQSAQTSRTLLNQVLVKSGGVWRVMSIFPIPAPAQ
ncbi:MAG TPA: nuclear transport factor 2 family protein, partial [Burkholderiaceae bacterium]|nr:nuclear transport factor 2 family protein [Burkholderiaceae bacterium]